jgi:hypothetical protein
LFWFWPSDGMAQRATRPRGSTARA